MHFQGNLPKTYFPTSWLRQQSVAFGWQVRELRTELGGHRDKATRVDLEELGALHPSCGWPATVSALPSCQIVNHNHP